MTTQKFSKKEAIAFGWETMKNNLWFFVSLLIVFALLNIIPYIITMMVWEVNIFLEIILYIIDFVLTIVTIMGLIKIILMFCDNQKGRIVDLFSQYRLFFNYLFGFILYMLIVFGGLILLIIPGIIWSIRFWFFNYLIIDKGLGPREALKKSFEITKGSTWNLLLFFLLIKLINVFGVIGVIFLFPIIFPAIMFVIFPVPSAIITAAFVWSIVFVLSIGLFATIPTTMVAMAFAYRKLLTQIEITQVSGALIEEIK